MDRGNEKVAYLYEPFHPGVLRPHPQRRSRTRKRGGIPVGMCGELAGDPLATVVLLGLGLDSFSMSSAAIPVVKRAIRGTSLADAKSVATAAMALSSSAEVAAYLSSRHT